MRIIAGTYRSRRLVSPAGSATRPTSDRLRETLFNVLAPRISGCTFVDLYAGTGAVGLEALSRGARHVFFAENAPAALQALRSNLAALGITSGYTLETRGAIPLLERLPPASVDLLYLDPPYHYEPAYTRCLTFLGSSPLLAPAAQVIAEHATKSPFLLPPVVGRLTETRTLKQGDTTLTFFSSSA